MTRGRPTKEEENEDIIPEIIITPDGTHWLTRELMNRVENYETWRRNSQGRMCLSPRLARNITGTERRRQVYDRMLRDRNLTIEQLREVYPAQTDAQRYGLRNHARKRYEVDPVLQEYGRTGNLPTD